MSNSNASATLNYLVQVQVTDHGHCDPHSIRKGIEEGVARMRDEGHLTDLDDETTLIHAIQTTMPNTLTDAVMHMLGASVDQDAEARKFLEYSLDEFRHNFAADRARVLTASDRELLLDAMTTQRIEWERNEKGSYLGGIVVSGLDSWHAKPDAAILQEVLFANPCISCVYDDEPIVQMMELFARPEVWAIVAAKSMADIDQVRDQFDSLPDQMEIDKIGAPANKVLYQRAEKALEVVHKHLDAAVYAVQEQREHRDQDAPTA